MSFKSGRLWVLGVGCLTLFVYTLTSGYSLTSGDSGELAAAICTFGVPHPPGYPLYTTIGYFWTHLLWWIPEINALNYFSGFCSAAAVGVTAYGLDKFLMNVGLNNVSSLHRKAIAVIASLSLAFSSVFWFQAIGTEVYALHAVILALSIYFGLALLFEKSRSTWIYIGALLGLGLSHHLTIVLTGPAFLYILVMDIRSGKLDVRDFVTSVLIGILIPFVFYFHLYYRSTTKPVFAWGDPSTFSNFIDHITAKAYRGYTFQSMDVAFSNLKVLSGELLVQFSLVGLILALIGLVVLWKKHVHVANFLAILCLSNILVAINYDITDLSAYFILLYITMAYFLAYGIYWVCTSLFVESRQGQSLVVFCLIPVFILLYNYRDSDFSDYDDLENYYTEAVLSLPENSILLTMEFEFEISSGHYYQLVKGVRPDIRIIDVLTLVNYNWYGDHLLQVYDGLDSLMLEWPELKLEIERAEDELVTQDDVDDVAKMLISNLIERSIEEVDVYISHWAYGRYFLPGGVYDILSGYQLVPDGYHYQIYADRGYQPARRSIDPMQFDSYRNDEYTRRASDAEKRQSEILRQNKYLTGNLRFRQARMIDHRIQYELKHNKAKQALELKGILERYFPYYDLPHQIEMDLMRFSASENG